MDRTRTGKREQYEGNHQHVNAELPRPGFPLAIRHPGFSFYRHSDFVIRHARALRIKRPSPIGEGRVFNDLTS